MAEDILKEHHHPEIWHGFKNLESKCLIKKLKQKNYEEIKAIDDRINNIVEESVKFAEDSPWPADDELLKDVYADKNYPFIVD